MVLWDDFVLLKISLVISAGFYQQLDLPYFRLFILKKLFMNSVAFSELPDPSSHGANQAKIGNLLWLHIVSFLLLKMSGML